MSAKAMQYVKGIAVAPNGERLTFGERAVLLYLADSHSETRGAAWPSVQTIATYFGVTRRAIQYHLAGLTRKRVTWAERRVARNRAANTVSHYWHFTQIDGPPSRADISRYLELQERGRSAVKTMRGISRQQGCHAEPLNTEGCQSEPLSIGKGCQKGFNRRHAGEASFAALLKNPSQELPIERQEEPEPSRALSDEELFDLIPEFEE
jgi:hypothetical protein